MAMETENTDRARQYLFGQMNDAERDEFEGLVFSDGDLAAHVDAVEHDLIDEYLCGEMESGRKKLFEAAYLTNDSRKMKLAAARVLHEELFPAASPALASPPPEKRSIFDLFRLPNLAWAGGIAALLIAVVIGGWMLLRPSGSDDEVANMTDDVQVIDEDLLRPPDVDAPEPDPEQNDESKGEPANDNAPDVPEKRTPPESPRIFAATLLPTMRSSVRPVLHIPREAPTVTLRLVHDNEKPFSGYRVEMRNGDGDVVFKREIPVAASRVSRPVSLTLDPTILKDGAYEIWLTGMSADGPEEELKFYDFSVRRR